MDTLWKSYLNFKTEVLILNVTVIGCGRWGSFLSWYFDSLGHNVKIYGREKSQSFCTLKETRKNEYVSLSENVSFTSDIDKAIAFSEYIVVSIGAQNTPELFAEISKTVDVFFLRLFFI